MVHVEKQNGDEPIAYRPLVQDVGEENNAGEDGGWVGDESSSSEGDNDEPYTVVSLFGVTVIVSVVISDRKWAMCISNVFELLC